jgi:hypothetical protein
MTHFIIRGYELKHVTSKTDRRVLLELPHSVTAPPDSWRHLAYVTARTAAARQTQNFEWFFEKRVTNSCVVF